MQSIFIYLKTYLEGNFKIWNMLQSAILKSSFSKVQSFPCKLPNIAFMTYLECKFRLALVNQKYYWAIIKPFIHESCFLNNNSYVFMSPWSQYWLPSVDGYRIMAPSLYYKPPFVIQWDIELKSACVLGRVPTLRKTGFCPVKLHLGLICHHFRNDLSALI